MSKGKASKKHPKGSLVSGSARNKATDSATGGKLVQGGGPTRRHVPISDTAGSKASYSEFSKVLEHYNSKKPFIIQRGFELFLDEIPRPLSPDGQRQIGMFANEWFVFDFKLPNGKTVLRDYIDCNPDKLTAKQLDGLNQAEQSNRTAEFWLNSVDREQHYLFLEDVITGEQIQVYDVSASQTVPIEAGMVIGRVIQQDGEWYFAGNPLGVLPIVPTKKLRNMLKNPDASSRLDKQFIDFFCALYCEPDTEDESQGSFLLPSEPVSAEAADQLIEDLHKQYNKLRKAQGLIATWPQLKRAILYENGQSSPLDVFTKIFIEDALVALDDASKAGKALDAEEVPYGWPANQDALVQVTEIFFQCWNLLPHKSLGGKSPNDLLRDSRQVDIEQLVEALDAPYDDLFQWYIDTGTMEISCVEEELLNLIDEYSDMPRNSALRKIIADASRLSVAYEKEEIIKWFDGYGDEVAFIDPLEPYEKYGIMESYIETEVDDDRLCERLERAIRGRGAFRRFKDVLADCDMLEDYYQFHNAEMRVFAREWLEDNGFIVLPQAYDNHV